MKKIQTIIVISFSAIAMACTTTHVSDKREFNVWKVKSDSAITWAKFYWTNDSLGDKYIERTAMFIPAKIEGLPYNFTFQFDLGSDLTVIYEKSANSVLVNHKQFDHRITKLKSVLQFLDKNKSFTDLTITFGEIKIQTPNCYVMRDFGDQFTIDASDSISLVTIGTIGADVFQGKVLIIDYPNQRFAICDSVPQMYDTKFIDIELDDSGKVILPMMLNKSPYRISFDNGSSIFPIITLAKNVSKFSTSQDIDTLKISSWGKLHDVTSKMISDTFELAGQKFSNVKVYANHSELGIDHDTDGTAGNALFWDKTIIIDFKNKRFGVK